MTKTEIITYKRPEVEVKKKDFGTTPEPILPSVPSITAHTEFVRVERNKTEERLVITFPAQRAIILHEGLIVESQKGERERIRKIEIAPGDKPREFHVKPLPGTTVPEFIIRLLPEERPANKKRSK